MEIDIGMSDWLCVWMKVTEIFRKIWVGCVMTANNSVTVLKKRKKRNSLKQMNMNEEKIKQNTDREKMWQNKRETKQWQRE